MNAAERSARANIDAATLRQMQAACDDATMKGILRDSRAPQSPSSMIPSSHSEPPPLMPSHVEPRPLQNPPGIALIDRQLEFLDAKEKAERVAEQNAVKAQDEAYRKFMEAAEKWDAAFAEFQKAMR
jgi:hypothetical protein